MGKVENLIKEVASNIPQNLSTNETIRYAYLYIGKKLILSNIKKSYNPI